MRIISDLVLASSYFSPLSLHNYKYYNPFLARKIFPSVLVSHKNKFVYLRVPKSGNTTMLNLLYESDTGEAVSGWDRRYVSREHFSCLGGLSLFKSGKIFNDYHFFTVVRSPYDRILSAYLDKFSMDRYIKKFPEVLSAKSVDDISVGLNSFLRFISKNKSNLYKDHHWIPQLDFMFPNKSRVDSVLYLESLNEGYKDLSKTLGFNGLPGGDNDYRGQGVATTNANLKRQLCFLDGPVAKENRSIVEEVYGKDFEAFGYKKDLI